MPPKKTAKKAPPKAAKKPAAKKAAPKKPAAKKAVVKKPAPKKVAPKKAPARKPAAKKAPVKKVAPKKAPAKKAPAKKAAPKKAAAAKKSKAVAPKAKKAAATAKKVKAKKSTPKKKPAPKKPAAKKVTPKKAAPKKAPAKKPTPKAKKAPAKKSTTTKAKPVPKAAKKAPPKASPKSKVSPKDKKPVAAKTKQAAKKLRSPSVSTASSSEGDEDVDGQLDPFLDKCFADVMANQGNLANNFGIGEGGSWFFDQQVGDLEFRNDDGKVYCKSNNVLIAGSYSFVSNTWLWGWNNDSIYPEYTDAARVAVLRKAREFDNEDERRLLESDITLDCGTSGENDGWRFASLICKLVGGVGIYRGPHTYGSTFFVMRKLSLVKKIK